jgi:hypothetical protein
MTGRLIDTDFTANGRDNMLCGGCFAWSMRYFCLRFELRNLLSLTKIMQTTCTMLLWSVNLSANSISKFFLKKFDYLGKFKKTNLVPLDKFKLENKASCFEFKTKVAQLLSDHTIWFFHVRNILLSTWTHSMARSGETHWPEEWIQLEPRMAIRLSCKLLGVNERQKLALCWGTELGQMLMELC